MEIWPTVCVMSSDNAELVANYWRAHRLSRGGREDRLLAEADASAFDEVHERVTRDPTDALTLIDDLLAADSADAAFVGAGPLEDLLVEHGAAVAQLVADRCRNSSAWQSAVAAVWLDELERSAVEPLQPLLPERG